MLRGKLRLEYLLPFREFITLVGNPLSEDWVCFVIEYFIVLMSVCRVDFEKTVKIKVHKKINELYTIALL